MAGVYLRKGASDAQCRDFHLCEKPFADIVGPFGLAPEDRESVKPDYLEPNTPLVVIVSVQEDEGREAGFEPGYYRAEIDPHRAIRHCGIGLADILGTAQYLSAGREQH